MVAYAFSCHPPKCRFARIAEIGTTKSMNSKAIAVPADLQLSKLRCRLFWRSGDAEAGWIEDDY
ncbi:MAG: hypothetical protein MZW92_63755 [Comamonadaceae bacterium]|nr:hypothetical protein [Comamonadaceae bacterium]